MVLVLAVHAGCGASLSASKAAAFNESTEGARLVLQSALEDTRAVATEAELDRALTEPQRRLTDSEFAPIISTQTKAVLLTQFDVLVEYSRALRKITDKTYRGEFASSVAKLNGATVGALDNAASLGATLNGAKLASDDTIANVKEGLGIFSGVAAALGEVAIDQYAQRKAYAIIVDKAIAISNYCHAIQRILKPTDGPDDEAEAVGLVALTRVAYRERKNSIQQYFHTLGARPQGMSEIEWRNYRKHVARQYAQLVSDEEQAKLRIIALRGAIGKIADAHVALAAKDDASFGRQMDDATDYIKFIVASYESGKKSE
jgi:hypothetical protein